MLPVLIGLGVALLLVAVAIVVTGFIVMVKTYGYGSE